VRSAGRLALALGLLSAGCGDDGSGDGSMNDSGGTEATGTADTGSEEGTADGTGTAGSGESGEDLGPWSSLGERPCPDDSFVTYESFGGPFLLTYCTGCHHSRLPADQRQGAPIDVNFDDLEDIRAWADRIWIRGADDNDSMPPVGPAGPDERALLGEWLACGAPTDADVGM